MDQEECHKESVEVFTSIQLDSLLLESSKAGHIKVMEILIQYRIRNFDHVTLVLETGTIRISLQKQTC